MSKVKKPTKDAVEILDRRYFSGNPKMIKMLEEERMNADVASKIYNLRTEAGFSQRDLARLVETTASVICRLENSDYHGHSLAMLRRIASALNKRIELKFLPGKQSSK